MKRYLALLLTVLTLFGAFGASFPALSVSAAGDREYFFDFEKYSVGAQLSGGELVPSGFFHQVDQDMIGNNGRVYYLASRAGRGDTQLTLKTDYAEKLIEFDYLYSGDFDKIGGFYTAAYQNGNDSVYTIFSPVYHFQLNLQFPSEGFEGKRFRPRRQRYDDGRGERLVQGKDRFCGRYRIREDMESGGGRARRLERHGHDHASD